MINTEQIKTLEELFDDHKNTLKIIEMLIKNRNLPDTFMPVIRERLEERIANNVVSILTFQDCKDRSYLIAAEMKHYYDGLIKQGFDPELVKEIIC